MEIFTAFTEDTDLENRKILVGVSGGVDSSVCVDLLKKQGCEVYGAVINFNDHSDSAITDAHKVCAHLDIPICVIDARENFEKNVVQPFCQNYISGRTPNPCIVCNPHVKFATLIRKADELGIGYIATGHYARIKQLDNGRFVVMNSATAVKDQTYALNQLTQDQLAHTIMPIGQYSKDEIRKIAKDAGIPVADKPDSQDICFIPDGDYAGFIKRETYYFTLWTL